MAFPSVSASAASQITVAASGDLTITNPNPRVVGQLLVCLLRRTGAGTHTYQAGWNKLVEDSSDASDDVTSLAYHQVEQGEPSTFVVTPSVGTEKWAAVVWCIADACDPAIQAPQLSTVAVGTSTGPRSEERRVGKECQSVCRSRWSPYH